MARLEGPLFSTEAHSTFAGRLEYSRRHGKSYVRNHQQPTGPASSGQTTIRGYFEEATEHWQTLSDEERTEWDTFNTS